ncbi:MAG: methionyl-tRNA formyltransferase [Planctomycetes bacterium]|nr:methionyl-tRNA formyltransferase [Planctomycetota bacterium]
MRLLFLGSGEFGLPTLQHLCTRHEVAAVISQPDREAGRHRRLTPTPIAKWAAENGLAVLKSGDVNAPDFIAQVKALGAEASIVIAFGQKLSEPLIAAMGNPVVNLHGSLLPRWRGAAPVNWAILGGDRRSGVSVISLAQRMDAGLIYAQSSLDIDPNETAGELHDRLAALGPDAVGRVLDDAAAGRLKGETQDESLATRARKLSKADGTIDWSATAEEIRRRVHGLTPWPGVKVTWFRAADGAEQPLAILRVRAEQGTNQDADPGTVLEGGRVAAGDGVVKLVEVQPPGGVAMSIADFTRGHRMRAGDRVG